MWRLPAGAEFVLDRLHARGYQAYVVGGCVRDLLLGRAPKDFDVCTDALPEQMQQVFADCHVIETGLRHGTLTVMYDHEPYEVTTFRVDGAYADHRHPDEVVFVTNVREDLARRDFTVNAMAWSPDTGLVDAFGGQEDLAAGIIRCVGDPRTRFDEDALRIMRAMRFASVYGFAIDPATDEAIHALRHTLGGVAGERIRVELQKTLCGAGAGDILRSYDDVMITLIPPLKTVDWPRTVAGVEAAPPTEALRLAMLLREVDADQVKAVLQGLRLDNATRDRVLTLVTHQEAAFAPSRHAMLTLLSTHGEEVTRQLLTIRRAKALARHDRTKADIDAEAAELTAMLDAVLSDGVCYTVKDMAVNGRDLMALGAQGKAVGACLSHLLELLLSETLPNDRAALLTAAKAYLG
ncbi:MAG: CCA tRNA nucleotidyltransferase [Clostridiales bacterium]|nr:CCA tRNA nucleotidyltransferase [Clostridiales bacterium]